MRSTISIEGSGCSITLQGWLRELWLSAEIVTMLGVGATLELVILPSLHSMGRDIADLREGMARMEGPVDLLTTFLIDRERAASAAGE